MVALVEQGSFGAGSAGPIVRDILAEYFHINGAGTDAKNNTSGNTTTGGNANSSANGTSGAQSGNNTSGSSSDTSGNTTNTTVTGPQQR